MTQHDPRDADAMPSPADALAIIAAQRARTDDTRPSGPLLFGVWGAAWLIGYGLIWLTSSDDDSPAGLTATVAITGGVIALVVTIVHVIRRTRGIVGASSRQGTMYGLAWSIGFAAQAMIVSGFASAGASGEVLALAGNAIAALVVGLLYLAGGMLWDSVPMYVIGGWMALVGGAAALAGLPGTYLVMAVAGGGGMLAAGLVERVRARA
ncbi:hypothetical protein [Cellulomonas fengjieae]|uniref:Transporter n=1 Tax=Cellulomonas fengjieae TaxID=2819978 RepID=A0ABS3SK30_9CELL|nr:hypothetical protein [Cellulomonas fengjieae]MBO3086108.1 hypothetical protein [Cellulomonas fengjieae]MBO3102488.1 hypothetical protein [Cellulomonas fengjieae]QVI65829.1 hypothetical protein KG102_17425 [Cellulomonas fengjieae]